VLAAAGRRGGAVKMAGVARNAVETHSPCRAEDLGWRELRRGRVVRAMAELAAERGFEGATLALVCARAGISRAGFYTLFTSREECFLAVMDECHDRACALLLERLGHIEDWRSGLRTGLAELLLFLDAEPAIARVAVVEALAAGRWALQRRERHAASLTRLVVENWGMLAPPEPHPGANVGVMASVLGTVQSHLAQPGDQPLIGLLGPLMGLATAPYLDATAVAEEVARAGALARRLHMRRAAPYGSHVGGELPAILANSRARRARECLLCIAARPGVSNREVARALGLVSHTQTSMLLGRLHAAGLLLKQPGLPGRPNAWALSGKGERMARLLRSGSSAQLEQGAGAVETGRTPVRVIHGRRHTTLM
jgi:AcrR family transcriptional regulator